MKTIVVANQKGGIGKTTTATAISSILEAKGHRTLLIDADQQGNSSDTYKAQIEGNATLYDVLLEEDRLPLAEAIQKTDNGEIVASDPLLRRADETLRDDLDGLFRLQEALETLAETSDYEYVVIDTAPSMNALLYNCLIAADYVVIPVTADRYAIQGLSQLSQTISAIKKRQNNKLVIAGLLLIKYNGRTNLAKNAKVSTEQIASQMGTKVFETTIRESTKAKEAQAKRETILSYAPNCTTAIDYANFVDELLQEVK